MQSIDIYNLTYETLHFLSSQTILKCFEILGWKKLWNKILLFQRENLSSELDFP